MACYVHCIEGEDTDDDAVVACGYGTAEGVNTLVQLVGKDRLKRTN